MIFLFKFFMASSTCDFCTKMFLKSDLFQCLIFSLIHCNFLATWDILEPRKKGELFHHFSSEDKKETSLDHICSNLKGFLVFGNHGARAIVAWMAKWSNPDRGRILVDGEPNLAIHMGLTKNPSHLSAICMKPYLLFVQVTWLKGMQSFNALFMIKSLKSYMTFKGGTMPPVLYFNERFLLKSQTITTQASW